MFTRKSSRRKAAKEKQEGCVFLEIEVRAGGEHKFLSFMYENGLGSKNERVEVCRVCSGPPWILPAQHPFSH